MKALVISMIFFSQFSMAARIVSASWDANSQSVVVDLVYQGNCLAHNFNIEWQACAVDPTTQKVVRLGLILDSGWQDTCTGVDQYQTLTVAEPTDGCPTQSLILKSTSSKIPVVIEK
ncbi:MAG: hypothetical protein B7Y39_05610 [Bdellovibrio sp. 28-41-41]|nr:MAG: hypothetical protein B7Y39_05610 [Bdellovibrio sp. 28-41-41]